MDGTRAPQGLDAEDRIALGLGATHLFYLVIFSMSGWAAWSSHLPLLVRAPIGTCLICTGSALAWGRLRGRPLDRWVVLYARFRLRPRRSAAGLAAAPTQPVTRTALPQASLLAVPLQTPPPAVPPTTIPLQVQDLPVITMAQRRARRVAFYSHSGGTGKTTLAVESATLVASLSGCRVALLDLDYATSTMRVRTGLTGPGIDELSSAANPSGAMLEGILLRHPGGMRVMLGSDATRSPERLVRCLPGLLSYLDSSGYDLVVMDLPTAALEPGSALEAVVAAVDAIYCVFTATPGSVMNLYRAVSTLRRAGLQQQARLVLNRHDTPVSLEEVLGDLRLELTASVPSLRGLADAEVSHSPACLQDESVSDAVYRLAEDIFPDMAARWFGRGRGALQAEAGFGS